MFIEVASVFERLADLAKAHALHSLGAGAIEIFGEVGAPRSAGFYRALRGPSDKKTVLISYFSSERMTPAEGKYDQSLFRPGAAPVQKLLATYTSCLGRKNND